jgi:hypothetical protein
MEQIIITGLPVHRWEKCLDLLHQTELGSGFGLILSCLVLGLELRVWGLEFRISGLGFRVKGLGFRVSCLILGLGFRVKELGFSV